MHYQEFREQILQELARRLPEADIMVREVLKNNNLRLDGLVISEHGINISPTIYLNYYYGKEENGASMAAVTEEILVRYQQSRPAGRIDISFLSTFENVKPRVVLDLVNLQMNRDLLRDVPYIPFMDLAIIFRILLRADEGELASALIHTDHMQAWGTDPEALFAAARENTPSLLPPQVLRLEDVLNGLPGDSADDPEPVFTPEDLNSSDHVPIYVLTNRQKTNGAGCMLYPGLLAALSERADTDFYILPSSIHEVLLVPSRFCPEPEALDSLVRSVNASDVPTDEILSDHAYYFSAQEGAVRLSAAAGA